MDLLHNHWYCTLHEELHLGSIPDDFSTTHREHLHPVYVDIAPKRTVYQCTGCDVPDDQHSFAPCIGYAFVVKEN